MNRKSEKFRNIHDQGEALTIKADVIKQMNFKINLANYLQILLRTTN